MIYRNSSDMGVIVRFCQAHDLVSAVVRMGTYGYKHSHVEIVLPNGDAIGAHSSNGVAIQAKDATPCHTISRQSYLIPCTEDEAETVFAFLRAQLGKKYDLSAIASIAASFFIGPRDWADDRKWFCSELSTAALIEAGILGPELKGSFRRITPRDLELIILSRQGIVTLPEERFE